MAENTDTAHTLYAAFNRRDHEAIEGLLHDDFLADMSRSVGPERGVYEGAKGLRELLAAYWQALETFEITLTEVSEHGDAVVVATNGRGIGRSSGAEVNARAAHLLDFTDGKVVRWTAFQSHPDAIRAAERRTSA